MAKRICANCGKEKYVDGGKVCEKVISFVNLVYGKLPDSFLQKEDIARSVRESLLKD